MPHLLPESGENLIVFEQGPGGRPARFEHPREIVSARSPDEVLPALAKLDAARAAGRWVAGMVAYEAASAFEPRLRRVLPLGRGPLVEFGVFEAPAPDDPGTTRLAAAQLGPWIPRMTSEQHRLAVRRVREHISSGDCYQVNLTFGCSAAFTGNPLDLYRTLVTDQAPGHAAYLDFGTGRVVVSASPELFFAVAGNRITARPMKGTRPRNSDGARDQEMADELVASAKDRAENLMIVDLLRNDISRLCQPGSVRVPRLFDVEAYPTVWQLTSTIEGDLVGEPGLVGLFGALFPCGSVTGAPKLSAMEVIAEVECQARGAYCGAIGWAGPDGDADFSVAIRTLEIEQGVADLHVGGGIVWDSDPASEWEEALWKTRFSGGDVLQDWS